MIKKLFFFILIPILLTSFGEVNLKNTVNNLHLEFTLSALPHIVFHPLVWLSVLCIIAGGVLWLVGMSKFELSFMYPFLTLNYVLIILGSIFVLKEKIQFHTIMAIFFIVLGLILISRSKYFEAQ